MKNLMTIAALGLVTACAAQARTEAQTEPRLPAAPLLSAETSRAGQGAPERLGATCEIRETRTAQGLRLEAVVEAGQAVRGDYDFVLRAQGPGGSSHVAQGGPVILAPGERAVLGAAETARGSYRASLKLNDADGELCRLERRS